jgi:hypothetical protein
LQSFKVIKFLPIRFDKRLAVRISFLQSGDVSFQTYAINPCTKAYVLVSGAGLLNDAFCGSFLNQKDGDVLSGTITGKTEQTRTKTKSILTKIEAT